MELTQSGLHQYFKTWQVLRSNPLINYDRLSTEGISIYTIMHAYIRILHNVFVGGFYFQKRVSAVLLLLSAVNALSMLFLHPHPTISARGCHINKIANIFLRFTLSVRFFDRKKKNTLKLVINSHVNYRVPLSYLLKTVLAR